MWKHTSLVAACGILLLAAGCGGGDGGGPTVYRLTSTLRSYQVGDQWVYSASGTWTGALGGSVPMGGTVTRTMSTMTMADTQYLGITVFKDLTPQSAMYQERRHTLLGQDSATREVCIHGDKLDTGYWRMVINHPEPVTIPGVWSAGTSLDRTIDYENGEHAHYQLLVRNAETVTTPVGTFETYRISTLENDPKYGLCGRTEWWHPGLGAPVKYTEQCRIPGGATLDYTVTLRSTTVTLTP